MNRESNPPSKSALREQERREYQQHYWQQYRRSHRRVYGRLSSEEYAAIDARAKEAGRSAWQQIKAESESYASGKHVPPQEVEERLTELIVHFRRIGNNLNQMAKEMHARGKLPHCEAFNERLDELEREIKKWVHGS